MSPGDLFTRISSGGRAALTGVMTLGAILVTLAIGSEATAVWLATPSAPQSAGAAEHGPSWERLPAPTDLPVERPLRAGFLIVDGVYNSELMAPYDILQHTIFHTEPGIEVFTVSPDGEMVTTFEGLRILPDYSFDSVPEIDILVVPSTEGSMERDLRDERLMAWVRRVGGEARYLMSLCDGAFVLAAAGLLDDVSVTTFPGDQDRFAAMFPALDLRRGISFVHDGKALTSEGGARSYDVAMYLVDHLYGEAAARGVATGMVIEWPPAAERMQALVMR